MLSLIRLSGSPYEAGRSLGKFGAEVAHGYLASSDAWQSVMAWKDTPQAQTMAAATRQRFPKVWDELCGLAAGLEMPLDEVVLWNCRGDVGAMAAEGCTTVQLPGAGGPRISHNEDGDPRLARHCALAEVAINQGARFAAFVYPASIPGHAFAVTEGGLAMTVNNLRSRRMAAGVPRMVLTRALLDQESVSAALDLLRAAPRAGGYHLSLAQRGHPELVSVEFNAAGVSARLVEEPAVHANHAVHGALRDFPQVVTESSRCRQARAEAMLGMMVGRQGGGGDAAVLRGSFAAAIDPLLILADQENAEFPIYRNAADDGDEENTLATADMHVGADAVRWQIYERPGEPARFDLVDARLS